MLLLGKVCPFYGIRFQTTATVAETNTDQQNDFPFDHPVGVEVCPLDQVGIKKERKRSYDICFLPHKMCQLLFLSALYDNDHHE